MDHDPVAERECYDDGLNYLPAEYICTKCRKRKKIEYKDAGKGNDLLLIPAFVAFVTYLVLFPVIVLIPAILKELFSKEKN